MQGILFASLFLLTVSGAHANDNFPQILDSAAMKDGREGRAYADPCENFYDYACGSWIEKTQLPPDRDYISRQTTPMTDASEEKLHQILVSYAQNKFDPPSTYAPLLGNYFSSCMNRDSNQAVSLQFFQSEVKKISTIRNVADLPKFLAAYHLWGISAFFSFGGAQDPKESENIIGDFGQGGTGFSNKDYYFKNDAKSQEIRAHYLQYMQTILRMAGDKNPQNSAAAVVKLETTLAQNFYSLVDQNDPLKTDHAMSGKDWSAQRFAFSWSEYFSALAITEPKKINVDEPEFFMALNRILENTPVDVIHAYLTWHITDSFAVSLGGEFAKAHFDFWDAYLGGAKEQKPLWKRCTMGTAGALGYPLAEAYIKLFDARSIKEKVSGMISEIKSTFLLNLQNLVGGADHWMDAATAAEAKEKIAQLVQKVGAPDKWKNYRALHLNDRNFLENNLAISVFEAHRALKKIGHKVDKSDWGMMPWEVNAYYDRSNNEFVFPFGILQPPSIDLTATNGANLGSFGGGTIGHELTHGFDNNGAKYDAKGNLRNWWSEVTLKQFQDRSQCYIQQANAYTIPELGANVNGELTLEENLADQGGIKLGYVALENQLKSRPEGKAWNGFSERQQFWIAYAQTWCTKITNESARELLTNDAHPPAEFRVNGVAMNRPEFARDFQCRAGSRLAPVQRCSLW